MRIGDYIIYPPLIIAAILIPLTIVIITILILNRKQDKKNLELNLITKYQKTKLVEILDEKIEDTPSFSKETIQLIRDIQGYIRRKRYWDPEELLELNEESLRLLTTVIFDRIKEDVEKNKTNEAVLLCHALDFINCGVMYEGNYIEWIGDEIEIVKNHAKMTDNEGRLFKIALGVVEKTYLLLDEDLDKIPEVINCDPELKTYNTFDFNSAYDDLESCVDFRNLKPETFDIIARGIVFILDDIIENLEKKYLPYYQVYYLRALACCLDRQLYDKILTSIDY